MYYELCEDDRNARAAKYWDCGRHIPGLVSPGLWYDLMSLLSIRCGRGVKVEAAVGQKCCSGAKVIGIQAVTDYICTISARAGRAVNFDLL